MSRCVIYLVCDTLTAGRAGVDRAITEAGEGGRVVLLFVHDPRREEALRENLSAGAFVGPEQVERVAGAAWAAAEACGGELVAEAARRARAAGREAEVAVARGPLLQIVEDEARARGAAAVVVERPGGRLLARLFEPRQLRRLRKAVGVPLIEVEPASPAR